MLHPQRRTLLPAVMVTNLTKKEAAAVRLTTVKMAIVLIARDLTVKTASVRSVLTTVNALIARVLILMQKMVATARSVLITVNVRMAAVTVLIVRATTAKVATVRNALTTTPATVLIARATIAKVVIVRSALTIVNVRMAAVTVHNVRAIIAKVVIVRSVLIIVNALLMATVTVLTARAITAKVAIVRSVLMETMEEVTVLIVRASTRMVAEDPVDTETEIVTVVPSAARMITIPMQSTARRNRLNTKNSLLIRTSRSA